MDTRAVEYGQDTPSSLQLQLQSTMKQIIIILLVLTFSSCNTSKSVQTEKEKVKIEIDSTFEQTLTNKTIEIEWILSDDTTAIPLAPKANNPETKENPEITPKKIPKYGKIKIRITQDTFRSHGKVEVTKKKITKSKEKKQNQVLKPKKTKSHFNFLYVIIFAFCVKYLWNHRNFFKKIWNLIK